MSETEPAAAAIAADPERGILLVRFTGSVRPSHLRAGYGHRATGAAYRPGMAVITDLREALFDASYEEMTAVMQYLDAIFSRSGGPPGSGAIVAPADLTFGLSRMYKLLTGDTYPTLAVFREWDEAIRWLEIDPAAADALAARLEPIDLKDGDGGRRL